LEVDDVFKETSMKLLTSCAAVALLAAVGGAQAADVGVSVQISQPGAYGRIDIGRLPVPQVVLPTPVLIAPPHLPRVVVGAPPPPPQPVYMWVPPGHQKDWGKHCGRYNACGVPVYFVQDGWYHEHVNPKGKGHGHDRDNDDRGRGEGRGEGHGKGHGKRD
jgi:hypothetical protein